MISFSGGVNTDVLWLPACHLFDLVLGRCEHGRLVPHVKEAAGELEHDAVLHTVSLIVTHETPLLSKNK